MGWANRKIIQGNRFRLIISGGILFCQSVILANSFVLAILTATGALLVGAAGTVVYEVLTDDVAPIRVLNQYEHLDKKIRKGLVTTTTRKIWDDKNAQGNITKFKINHHSTYYQNTGSAIIKSNSSQEFEPEYSDYSAEQIAIGLLKQAPLEVRDYQCILTDNDSDTRKTKFGYRIQWNYRDGADVKPYWKDNRRFKVILKDWTPMPGKTCGEQYNNTGAWYVSPSISRHGGNGEIICSADQYLGGTVNLQPHSSSQLLFKEHVWP